MSYRLRRDKVGEGIWRVVAADEIDLNAAPELEARIGEVVAEGAEHVIVDLSEATFIDSTAVGVLVEAHRRLQSRRRGLEIVGSDRRVLFIFEITGLDRVFRIHPTVEDAVKALTGS